MALLGLLLRGWAAGTIHKNEQLTTSGPYAYTRNPLYLGSLLLGIGVSLAGGAWAWPVLFAAAYLAIYTRTMREEAGRLESIFPGEFAAYRDAVPAFAPSLRPYRPNEGIRGEDPSFSWSRYVRNREWEAALGLTGAFVVLALKWWMAAASA